MNISVVNASVAISNSQPSQKNLSEQSNEFNKTFSSLLDQSSTEPSNEQSNDEKETTQMMDDLASLMVPLPLLNLTQLPITIEGDVALVQEAHVELEMTPSLTNMLNVQGDSIENLDLSGTLGHDLIFDEGDDLSQDEHLLTKAQSQISSGLKSDENKSLSENLQQMDSVVVDKQSELDENSSLKKVVDKPLNQEQNGLQNSQSLELDSFEGKMRASQELLEQELKSIQDSVEGKMRASQELLEQDLDSIQDSVEGKMKSVQESMVVNNTTVFLKDVTAHEASLEPMSGANYFKWDNQSEIMSNLRHQISILKENDYTTLQLKLYPQQLGSISVELKMKNGVLNAHVLVEQSELKSVIEQEFHQINLDGTKIEQLNVEVNAQSQQQSQSQKATKTVRRFTLEDDPLEELEMATKENEHTGYLNLTV